MNIFPERVFALEHGQQYGSKLLGFLLTLSGGLLWAIGGSCGQRIFELYDVSADWLVPIRLLVSSAILLLFAFYKCGSKQVLEVFYHPKDRRNLILFSLFGAGASQYTYYTCIQYSNAAFATVISYMFPVIILLYGVFRTKRLPKGYEFISVILVTAGAFICTTHLEFGTLSVSPVALLFGLLAAVTSAYNTIKPQGLLRTYPLMAIMGLSMGISGIVLTLLCRPWHNAPSVSAELILLMSVIVIGGTIFAFCFFQAGVRILGGLVGGILASVEPVGAVLISVLFLGVAFTIEDFIGFLLILATIPIISLGQYKDEAKALRSEKEPSPVEELPKC